MDLISFGPNSVWLGQPMNWIAYYLDNVWMRKHMDQIACGLDSVRIRCIVKNWTEIWLRISENLITITGSQGYNMDNLKQTSTKFLKSRRISGDSILAEDIGKPNNNHNLNNFSTKGQDMDNFKYIYNIFKEQKIQWGLCFGCYIIKYGTRIWLSGS